MLEQARGGFVETLSEDDRVSAIELCEISMHNLLRGRASIRWISSIGRTRCSHSGKPCWSRVCAEFHRIAAFLNRCTSKPVGIVLSIGLLNELFKAKWSENLAGGLLESFGRLFKEGVTLHVFPWKNRRNGELVTAETFMAPANCVHLYRHFVANGRIQGIPCEDEPGSRLHRSRCLPDDPRGRRPLARDGPRSRLDHGRAACPPRKFLNHCRLTPRYRRPSRREGGTAS